MKRLQRANSLSSNSLADRAAGQEDLLLGPGKEPTTGRCVPASWPLSVAAASLIVFSAITAYHNSFAAPFVYDDGPSIAENRTIRRLWPIWQIEAFSPPSHGETVSGRPLLNLSLAINYALGGVNVWGYHAANLAIHVAAALLLFGILRRTLFTPPLRDRFGKAALPLALACALLWVVHPLQTESVTYIVQRAESLAGLFYLLTLYCVIRGVGEEGAGNLRFGPLSLWERVRVTARLSATSTLTPALSQREREILGPRPLFWYAAAVLACLCGMATKEVLVTAPLVVLLYDRTFLAGSLKEALRRRWALYLGLAATWGLLAYLMFSTRLVFRQQEMGSPSAWQYARTQPAVILHYLRLSLWPRPLCFEYAWPVANTVGKILPAAMVVGLLLAATLWGLRRSKAWAFPAAWTLIILAPTSTILPLRQLAFEHRMYLSLAGVVVLMVAGGYALWDRSLSRGERGRSPFSPEAMPGGIVSCAAKKGTVPGLAAIVRGAAPLVIWAAVLFVLGDATVRRNFDYRSPAAIWQDAVDKRPNNPTAEYNLAATLADLGKTDEAREHYQRALQLDPNDSRAHFNLGKILAGLGSTDEAMEHYQQALQLDPDDAAAHHELGLALARIGKLDKAIEHYHEVLRLSPLHADGHLNLAKALTVVGRSSEAVEQYDLFLVLKPDSAEGLSNLAWLLATCEPAQGGDPARAVELAQRACELSGSEDARGLDTLAAAYAAAGRFVDAAASAKRAVELAETAEDTLLATAIHQRLQQYRAGRPCREAVRTPRVQMSKSQ